MTNRAAASDAYQQALKAGRKAHRQSVHRGSYPYLQVLDEILTDSMTSGEIELGLIEIPTEKIVGTKSRGRTNAFASNFMPILAEESEFGMKWMRLCEAHLSDEGISDPIECYEYLGRFYVQEGNKRVSVLKHFGAPTVYGYVTRVIPKQSEAEEVQLYNEFLAYYPLIKLYQISFSRPGSFPKLQVALGFEADHEWTAEERRRFLSRFYYFRRSFDRLGGGELKATPADALLVWLKVYPFEALKDFTATELTKSLQAVWPDIKAIGIADSIEVSTEDSDSGAIKHRGIFALTPPHVNIAFIHELSPETSNWVKAHELGREQLERKLGSSVSAQCFTGVGSGAGAEEAMEKAIENGAEVIFATTVSLIAACRKVAARHPEVKILNCSISMPYTGVRTYYSRIYEGKFISGAIAGAISRSDEIGYIASYPIFGVPAGINAFALGAQLTNPDAKVVLKWACIPGDPVAELKERKVDFVSTLDIPMPGWEAGQWGTFRMLPDGSTRLIASPYWNWGEFYIRIVRNILNGEWDSAGGEGRAVNYWWGMASGVIGVEYTENMPLGVKTLVELLRSNIISGGIHPFKRPILSQDGTQRSDGSAGFSPETILHMDWLCENVEGSIPPFESLTAKAQAIVRLQGIYRDRIPPEKEAVLL